ncbi:MAG: hypothetical protein HG424_003160 [candidate division SR1 bacterium]|nr:hypothetical protein [candidate division SR1 bacterium]
MTRKEKISAIYAEMANKELTFGCKVKFSKGIYSIIDREDVGFLSAYKGQDGDIHNTIVIEDGVNSRCYSIEEIIGHPVMIGDVLDYLEDKRFYCEKCKKIVDGRDVSDCRFGGEYYCDICNNEYLVDIKSNILFDWSKKREPVEAQSDECVDFVYSLIQK